MNGSSARPKDRPLQVLIVCYSRYGVVKLLAERIGEGAGREPGVEAELLIVEDLPVTELRSDETPDDMRRRRAVLLNQLTAAEALIVGSPSYFGSMAAPLKRFFEDCTTAEGLRRRIVPGPGGTISSATKSGRRSRRPEHPTAATSRRCSRS